MLLMTFIVSYCINLITLAYHIEVKDYSLLEVTNGNFTGVFIIEVTNVY